MFDSQMSQLPQTPHRPIYLRTSKWSKSHKCQIYIQIVTNSILARKFKYLKDFDYQFGAKIHMKTLKNRFFKYLNIIFEAFLARKFKHLKDFNYVKKSQMSNLHSNKQALFLARKFKYLKYFEYYFSVKIHIKTFKKI